MSIVNSDSVNRRRPAKCSLCKEKEEARLSGLVSMEMSTQECLIGTALHCRSDSTN
jgi:hypothetical protein